MQHPELAELVKADRAAAVQLPVLDRLLTPAFRAEHPDRAFLFQQMGTFNTAKMADLRNLGSDGPSLGELNAAPFPVLLLAGEQDSVLPVPGPRLRRPWHATGVTEVLGPGEGHARFEARGSVMMFKALAELDDGDLSLMERTLPPGGRRPPAHRHTNCSEAYFVLDGEVLVTVGDQDLTAGPEGFVLVPRGTAHTFGNVSAAPARLLVIHAPAMDAYFAALHGLWHRDQPPTPDEERELMARFGMERA